MVLNVWGMEMERSWVKAAVVPVERERPRCSVWAREVLGFEADEEQARILDGEGRRVLMCCTRQWGKTTVTAARVLYEMWFTPGTLVAVVSVVKRQSQILVSKVMTLAERRLGVKARRDPRAGDGLSMLLPNGSAVVGLPATEDTTRGLSGVNFLILDEAARVPDEVYQAVRPFLATTGGRLWAMSTPDGQAGFFHDEWHEGGPEWTRVMVKAPDCPRIPAEFLEEERRALGDQMFRQEYLCEFVASRGQLVPRAVFDEAVTENETPLDGAERFGQEGWR